MLTQFVAASVRRKGLMLALIAGLLLLLPAGPVNGQGKDSGIYLAEAFTRVTDNAALAKKLVGYGYSDGICVLGAWVNEKETVAFDMPLTAGTSYMFLAAGDKDAEDVDLEILDAGGKVLAEDTRTDPDAVVEFTPKVNGTYTMRVTLFKARGQVPCICVATVLKKGGFNVPLKNLDSTAGKLIVALADADNVAKKANKRLDFHKAKNQWALYGAILKEKQDLTVSNLQLGRGAKAFIAVGDNNAEDVDLFLMDKTGKTVKEDTRTDPVASFVHEPAAGAHSLRMLNFKGNGASVVMMAIFDIQ